jgi:anti-sigma regulatory factor (Ser/Thr protein kinase)
VTRIGRAVHVSDASEVAVARRTATQCAQEAGLDETMTGRAALVATELATNLAKHGDGGSILMGNPIDGDAAGVTLVAIDKGRGIPSVPMAFEDGFSTAGSPGTGLGAIRRSAAAFDVFSAPERGTAIVCHVSEPPRARPVDTPARTAVGGICLPKSGEDVPGDAWYVVQRRETTTILVADGLGHGPAAATAAALAVRSFAERPDESIEVLLREAHTALRPTRGAAAGVARIHTTAGRLEFGGVGNIAGAIVSDEGFRRVVSLPGIVGHEMRKVQTFSYPWTPSSVLVMQSDGISSSWNPASYPGLLQRDAILIAAVLYRDHCRGTDDATVVVAKALTR